MKRQLPTTDPLTTTTNGDNVQTAIIQKISDLVLHLKLEFNEHISNKINEGNNIIGIMKKLSLFLSRKTFTNKNSSASPSKLK